MNSADNYLGLIPARGGSKGVERKNIQIFAGEPLIGHTIRSANEAQNIDRIIVTTDDEEIKSVAESYGAEVPFIRPSELATDEAPTNLVIDHALFHLETEEDYLPEAVVLLQPTSPLRTAEHIDGAIDAHLEKDVTTVISVYRDHSYRWQPDEPGATQLNYTGSSSRRQDKQPEYVENGAIYATETLHFLDKGKIRGGSIGLFEMSKRESIDIDTEFDFWLAETIKQRLEGEI
jgi:N-acylneuraminate cytidylyltransferase/CMP-N,N'-diacetyllegionaminic acid synthase